MPRHDVLKNHKDVNGWFLWFSYLYLYWCDRMYFIYIYIHVILYIYKTLERFVIYIYTYIQYMYLCQYCFVYIYIHRVAPFFPTFSNQLYWTMFDYTFGFGYRFGQMPVHCWFATTFFFFWLHFPFILGYTTIFPQFSPVNYHLSPGWWFQTFLIFHNIWDVILLIDFHISDGAPTSHCFFS